MQFTRGNLLEANAEAVVNTVNTIGVMGKGIALMFKERYPDNFRAYRAACENGQVEVGHMFITERRDLVGPRWIVNFPTKKHWRQPSRLEWIEAGLHSLAGEIESRGIRSIAIPPLGAGNGGLEWTEVRPLIEKILKDVSAKILVFEPTEKYQNVVKRHGVEKLTPSRAMMAEMIRRYAVLGIDCTILEAQKLAWFLQKAIEDLGLPDTLKLSFQANRYGPYDDRLRHLLDSMDGSYLQCAKRLADAKPLDSIWFRDERRELVQAYMTTPAASPYRAAIDRVSEVIDGFESPFGMELLATVDWLRRTEGVPLTVEAMAPAIRGWKGADASAAERKAKLFQERDVQLAVEQLDRIPIPLHA